MKKILILSNHASYTYNFRREIIQKLIEKNFSVYIVLPYGSEVELLKKMGCIFIDLPLDRRGMNPLKDLKLLYNYYKIIKAIGPDALLTYTLKPNIYGGLISRFMKVPFFPNVTGLGSAVENKSILQIVLVYVFRVAYKDASCIFFQNEENMEFFRNKNIPIARFRVIPGSGVNTNYFSLLTYPSDETIEFMFISRIMKQKGIDQYLEAAEFIRGKYTNTRFHVLGFCEEEYEEKLQQMQTRGIIEYHGMQSDVRKYHKISHCTIHPTYYPEGMSNVLLESCSCGRPIITTDRSGCREIIDDGINGFLVKQKNTKDLIEKIEKFINLSYEKKKLMGLAGREKVERKFGRDVVVNAYIEEIRKLED
jgi:Glycosyltransferase